MPDNGQQNRMEAAQLFLKMQEGIKKSGGVFCQYRRCGKEANTIYDIENIRNNVIFARSPLYMNDPFDSMIGFSTEKLYQGICHVLVQRIENEDIRSLIEVVFKYKFLGELAEFISLIKDIQRFLVVQRQNMKEGRFTLKEFFIKERNNLYKKMPPALQKRVKNKNVFAGICLLFADQDLSTITEENILDMINISSTIEEITQKIEEIKKTAYLPAMTELLKKITVSCFSASGWDNQLMWSHYANNYSGICVEYDFTKIDGDVGFVFPVSYSKERPTLSLDDLGISLINSETGIQTVHHDIDIKRILDYLLVKNECWKYEAEWRIVNPSEPDQPSFIYFPHILSITLGLHIDEICKHLVIDVCREKDIPCYELQLDTEKFSITRQPLDLNCLNADPQKEAAYIEYLSDYITEKSDYITSIGDNEIYDEETGCFDYERLIALISDAKDVLFSFYCIKRTVNNYLSCVKEATCNEDYESIKTTADQIDRIVEQLNMQPKTIIQALTLLKATGKIQLSDYNKYSRQVEEYSSLYDRTKELPWGLID